MPARPPSRRSPPIRDRWTRRWPRSCSATTRTVPATAVGALGALIKTNPQAASPVFHLGLLLLWIKRNALAEQEFAKAVKLDPNGRIGRVAKAFLDPLKAASG